MKKSEKKINNRRFTLLEIAKECSTETVKKFKSLESISMEQRRKDASQPLYLYRYE
jgi:hypothetical protein